MVAIVASLHSSNLFSSLPSTPPPKDHSVSPQTPPPSPPIPIPKYPPPRKKSRKPDQTPPNPALKTVHRRTKYFKPVRDGVISSDGDRSVVIGESGVSYHLPGAPFEFQFSYSETPKVKPTAIREPAFLPFAPPTMPRPWTGKAPLKSSKKKIPLFDSFNPPPPGKKGVKHVEMPGPFPLGKYPEEGRTREEILGEPLKKWEIRVLVTPFLSDNRQVNLGRDGLTHNMLELVHTHWKRRRVCKVRCKGVPTVDMDNVCHHLEEKTGGKVIHRVGGVVYLFRGRNYNYRTRPQYPVMLWKPAAPVYPKLIQEAPEGLTKAEADDLRKKGKALLPICKLAKNGVYINLVNDVRYAFEGSLLVKIDCTGMHASDYKKLGAKLKELVPCVLLSFDDEQILIWRGRDWKSIFPASQPALALGEDSIRTSSISPAETDKESQKGDTTMTVRTSPRMLSLWKQAIESEKAMLLDEIALGPDALLEKVEEFEGISQLTEHSYPALILSSGNGAASSKSDSEDSDTEESRQNLSYQSDDDLYQIYNDDNEDEEDDDYDEYEFQDEDDSFDDFKPSIPHGSLGVDSLAEKLRKKGIRK